MQDKWGWLNTAVFEQFGSEIDLASTISTPRSNVFGWRKRQREPKRLH